MSLREVGLVMLGLAIWLAIALVPVSWPLSDPGRSPFLLGPISADVPAGQTFRATEPFDRISIPVRIGGPFGQTNQLSLRIDLDGRNGSRSVRSGTVRVQPASDQMEQITFEFEEPIAASELLYFEIEVSPAAERPTFTMATLADQTPDGRLYLEGAPGFADQDLVFQLLRQQSSRERLTVWWSLYPAMLVTGVFLLALVHITVFSIFRAMAEAEVRWLRRVRPSVATLLTVAVSLGTIFAFAFFR